LKKIPKLRCQKKGDFIFLIVPHRPFVLHIYFVFSIWSSIHSRFSATPCSLRVRFTLLIFILRSSDDHADFLRSQRRRKLTARSAPFVDEVPGKVLFQTEFSKEKHGLPASSRPVIPRRRQEKRRPEGERGQPGFTRVRRPVDSGNRKG